MIYDTIISQWIIYEIVQSWRIQLKTYLIENIHCIYPFSMHDLTIKNVTTLYNFGLLYKKPNLLILTFLYSLIVIGRFLKLSIKFSNLVFNFPES